MLWKPIIFVFLPFWGVNFEWGSSRWVDRCLAHWRKRPSSRGLAGFRCDFDCDNSDPNRCWPRPSSRVLHWTRHVQFVASGVPDLRDHDNTDPEVCRAHDCCMLLTGAISRMLVVWPETTKQHNIFNSGK